MAQVREFQRMHKLRPPSQLGEAQSLPAVRKLARQICRRLSNQVRRALTVE